MKVQLKGGAVRALAARQNLTMQELAASAGLDVTYLYRLLRGQHQPGPRLRKRLCERWNVPYKSLFALSDRGQNAPR